MFNRLTSIFDSNNKQLLGTDKALARIKELREVMKDTPYDNMKSRIKEMQTELRTLVEKIPSDAFLSLTKVDRTKEMPAHERVIRDKLYEFMPEVYAMVDEVFRRKTGYNYHDVQLKAAIILSQGQRLTELYTGEGKTRTFQLPLILYSLVGRGAHLITVNDYLSRRDGEYAGHIATELGLTVGIINSSASYKFIPDSEIEAYKGEEGVKARSEMTIDESKMNAVNLIDVNKKESYNCDITYGTNNEFGFDYLRDNMAGDLAQISQRELYFCIIDEADSILIDEARTPLIISGIPSDADTKKYRRFAEAVKDLEEDKDYVIEHKSRSVTLTEVGIQQVETNLGEGNLWKDYSMAYHIENALKAKAMFHKDDQYLVRNGEVLIVDEFTGRTLKGRRYSEGLHQAIEAKEGVSIQQESKTFATITFQNFFRLYKILCGGSGTVMTEAEEFYKIYGLESVSIPTNKPVVRKDFPDLIYKSQEGKFKAVVKEIRERHEKGQPILVGTTSVDKSEYLSSLLDKEGIPHEVLNAKYHEQEAKIIEQAGRKGAVTVATNMAGRGADIIIGGGRRGDDAWKEIADIGGLHVIGTERHEARRIDNQLRGRTGRQGEPGSSRFYVALDDQLMKVLGGEIMGRLMNMVGLQEDMPIELKLISRQIETAQKRIESVNFDSRKRIVEYDDVMNQHREIFYSRRRGFLDNFEGALGKFIINKKYIDLQTLQDTDKRSEYEKLQSEFREKVKQLSKENFLSNIEKDLIYITENSKKDEGYKKLQETILKYGGSSLFQIPSKDEVQGLKEEELVSSFLKVAEEGFDKKLKEFGEDFYYLAKVVTLQSFDNLWVDHLELMKDIREGIGLRAYAQKDPLVEYKNEAYVVFTSFISKADTDVSKKILNVYKVQQPIQQKLVTNDSDIEDISSGDREFTVTQSNETEPSEKMDSLIRKTLRNQSQTQASLRINREQGSQTKVSTAKEIGRNDKVNVRYSDGRELKDVKYKKVEEDVKSGVAVLIS
jgi:preprotein translocase subunit SecA